MAYKVLFARRYLILFRSGRGYVTCNVISINVAEWLTDYAGGGILATAKTESSQSLGNKVILLGLAIQVIFFGLFIIVTLVVHIRINKGPSPKSLATPAPWQKLLWVLYLTSFLIMIRSIFRMVEYAQGSDGSLLQNETYAYVLDALLMFIVTACFVFFHPSKVLNKESITREDAGFQGSGDEYLMSKGNGFARI